MTKYHLLVDNIWTTNYFQHRRFVRKFSLIVLAFTVIAVALLTIQFFSLQNDLKIRNVQLVEAQVRTLNTK